MFPSCYSNLPKNGAYANTSVTKVAVGVFVVYVLHTCWVLYGFVYTKPCDTRGDSCITPYFAENPQVSHYNHLLRVHKIAYKLQTSCG